MPAPSLTTRALNRALLARQMLLAREKATVRDAVHQLVAMQAQVARPPFVGLWTRLQKFRREDLLDGLTRRKIVRGTSLRGTLHVMTADDFVGLRGALQPALTRGIQVILGDRLKDVDFAALEKEARAFFHGDAATFDALRKHLKSKTPNADERALAYAIRVLLPLIQVPTDAPWGFPASADFAIADAWLGRKISTAHVSPHMLIERYLAAFGPATPADAQTWSALQGLRGVFEELRPKLATFRDERKRELFDVPDAPRPSEDTPAPVRFLPEFDNVLLSHADRTRIIADEHRSRVFSKNLQVRATFLVDGLVAGTWSVDSKKTTATLVLEPFAAIARKVKAALEEEGEGLLRFLEEDAATRNVRWAA